MLRASLGSYPSGPMDWTDLGALLVSSFISFVTVGGSLSLLESWVFFFLSQLPIILGMQEMFVE